VAENLFTKCLTIQGQYFSELECSLSSDMFFFHMFFLRLMNTPAYLFTQEFPADNIYDSF